MESYKKKNYVVPILYYLYTEGGNGCREGQEKRKKRKKKEEKKEKKKKHDCDGSSPTSKSTAKSVFVSRNLVSVAYEEKNEGKKNTVRVTALIHSRYHVAGNKILG